MYGKEKGREVYISGAEEYIARIKNKYDAMSKAERRLANYFLEHQYEQDGELNIKDTARHAHTSIATVVRFCRTLGFKGFSEFKYSIQAGEMAPIGGKLRISSADPIGMVKQKIVEFTKRNIATSIQCTDNRELERAINALEKCGRMIISSDGTSSGVALAAANAFTYIGIPCFFPGDSLTMLRAIYLCGEKDIVMGISNCGYIKSVVDALKVAKERGATTIGVSAVPDSLVTKYSDIVLASRIADNSVVLNVIGEAISQLLTLQTLQIGYLARHSNEVAAKMKDLYQLNDISRYALDLESVANRRVRF